MPWAIIFPGAPDALPRHPSQIYEALLEGLAVFVILAMAARGGALRRPGFLAGGFGVLYGLARIFCEFFREPDPGLEDLGGGLTMGMLLSAPMIAIGLGLIFWSLARPRGAGMSALGDEIKAMIASDGPITLERYMELALGHPEHGYYMGRDPFGAAGDFITAPEISQMFGELLGLWAAEVWASMGRPRPVRLIELGPGRGTMMSDALRAARIVPDFRSAIDVTLVETSPTLAEIQHETLLTSGAPVGWIPSLAEAPEGPAIVLANEFLDALPARQYVRSGGRWRERIVRLDKSGELEFAARARIRAFILASGEEGDMLEVNPAAPPSGVRTRRPPRQTRRRRAVHRLWPRLHRDRRYAAGRASPPHGRPARRSRRGGPHRTCRFRRDGAQRARGRARRFTARSNKAISSVRSA